MRLRTVFLMAFLVLASCRRPDPVAMNSPAGLDSLTAGPREELTDRDIIPDFSTVGYRNSDAPYPDYQVVETVSADRVPSDDATGSIQAAIDKAAQTAGGGTVLLRNGTYHLKGVLFLDRSNVILRGESREGTVLVFEDTLQKPAIVLGRTVPYDGASTAEVKNISGRRFELKRGAVESPVEKEDFGKYYLNKWEPASESPTVVRRIAITEDYCPVGRFCVRVAYPERFSVGESVLLERPHNNDWISDIGMDRIASNGRTVGPVVQWSDRNIRLVWYRRITAIEGNYLWFDAPLVQSFDSCYGGGYVCKYKLDRISGSGLENLTIDSSYDPAVVNGDNVCVDEKHLWFGVFCVPCEDCFIRNVTARHIGFSAVEIGTGVVRMTVEGCSYVEPVSAPKSSRRYGFCLRGADLCLLKECYCEQAAIGFATNDKGGGPNVFYKCRGENMRTGAGPHQSWSTGNLYDCCFNSASFRCTDHGNSGTGHGWCGANTVFWNVETPQGFVECESPWAYENTPSLTFHSLHTSGRNYSIGTICDHRALDVLNRDYYGNPVVDYFQSIGFPHRPDAKWYPQVNYGQGGSRHISLPCPEAEEMFDWWPEFNIDNFSDPLSLYQCQLEDRKSRLL